MNNGLFQPVQQQQFPMLDPNGSTNGIPNSVINASRQRANQPPQPAGNANGWMSPEQLRAQTGRLQSMGGPAQMGMQPFAPQNDMQTMDPNATPQQTAPMPTMEGAPNSATDQIPTYVGNPVLDKYIHAFIGAV